MNAPHLNLQGAQPLRQGSRITDFTFNDTRVFGCTSKDLLNCSLEQAHALCLVLSTAVDHPYASTDEEIALRAPHISIALDAIGTLLGLAAMAAEDDQAEQRLRPHQPSEARASD